MVYVPPEETTPEISPLIIPMPFPETMPEKVFAPLEKFVTLPAHVETIPTFPAPAETVHEPFLPTHPPETCGDDSVSLLSPKETLGVTSL
ncbi:hypothetical protein NPIL_198351 [Nephila pilipes]|uniref:Uncharacterized protein n=1 Tax=Nephila pilipes TaxID=299642 RepID=A0A8X6U202_NEPPI|nr:hypothetical protein NPIL_198351 [Nephila pilipes]